MEDMIVCDVCGGGHDTACCPELGLADGTVLHQPMSKARLSLPPELEVVDRVDVGVDVRAASLITSRTKFGPFEARQCPGDFDTQNIFVLKILNKDGSCVTLDTSSEDECNWLCLVTSATHVLEQNCIAYQMGINIFYSTIRDIQPGQALRVWYAPYYAKKLIMPGEPDGVTKTMLEARKEQEMAAAIQQEAHQIIHVSLPEEFIAGNQVIQVSLPEHLVAGNHVIHVALPEDYVGGEGEDTVQAIVSIDGSAEVGMMEPKPVLTETVINGTILPDDTISATDIENALNAVQIQTVSLQDTGLAAPNTSVTGMSPSGRTLRLTMPAVTRKAAHHTAKQHHLKNIEATASRSWHDEDNQTKLISVNTNDVDVENIMENPNNPLIVDIDANLEIDSNPESDIPDYGNLDNHKSHNLNPIAVDPKVLKDKLISSNALKGKVVTPDENNMYTCIRCQDKFESKMELAKHISRHLRPLVQDDLHTIGQYECMLCGNTFVNQSNLSRHLKWHKGHTFSCSVCEYITSCSDTLHMHIKNVHGNKITLVRQMHKSNRSVESSNVSNVEVLSDDEDIEIECDSVSISLNKEDVNLTEDSPAEDDEGKSDEHHHNDAGEMTKLDNIEMHYEHEDVTEDDPDDQMDVVIEKVEQDTSRLVGLALKEIIDGDIVEEMVIKEEPDDDLAYGITPRRSGRLGMKERKVFVRVKDRKPSRTPTKPLVKQSIESSTHSTKAKLSEFSSDLPAGNTDCTHLLNNLTPHISEQQAGSKTKLDTVSAKTSPREKTKEKVISAYVQRKKKVVRLPSRSSSGRAIKRAIGSEFFTDSDDGGEVIQIKQEPESDLDDDFIDKDYEMSLAKPTIRKRGRPRIHAKLESALPGPDAYSILTCEDGTNEYTCLKCDARFDSLKSFQDHYTIHSSSRYCCSLCEHDFGTKARYGSHSCPAFKVTHYMSTDKDNDDEKDANRLPLDAVNNFGDIYDHFTRVLECSECQETFEDMDAARDHGAVHKGEYKCGVCEQKFDRQFKLSGHVCSGSELEAKENQAHICEICGAIFDSMRYLRKHMGGHTGQFQCFKCDRHYGHRDTLMRHILKCDPERADKECIQACVQCGRGFATITGYNKHLESCEVNHCRKCNKLLPSKISLFTDDDLEKPLCVCVHENPNDALFYRCKDCGRMFKNKRNLIRHEPSHSGVYKCLVCNRNFSRKEDLDRHSVLCEAKRMIENNGFIVCSVCDSEFLKADEYNEHYNDHLRPFQCKQCQKRFRRPESLRMHSCMTPKNRTFCCEVCGKVLHTAPAMENHLDEHFEPTNECPRCLRKFHQDHMLTHHKCFPSDSSAGRPRSVLPKRKDSHICHLCGQKLTTNGNLNKHLKRHGERDVPCPICGKNFHFMYSLREHVNQVHDNKWLYECNVCKRNFKSRTNLSKHKKEFHAQILQLYACPTCGKTFRQKGNLNKHLISHSDKREYKCEYCLKTFKYREHYVRHRLQHTMVHKMKCPYCERLFVEQYSLNKHVQEVHCGQAYVCEFCEIRCSLRHSIVRHYKRKHPKESHLIMNAQYVKSLIHIIS